MNFQPVFFILNPEIITLIWIMSLIAGLLMFGEYFLVILSASTFLYWLFLSIFIHVKLRHRFKNIQNSILPDDMKNPVEIGFFHSKTGIHVGGLFALLSIVIILVPIFCLVNFTKGWTKSFSNTFGYTLCYKYLEKSVYELFQDLDKAKIHKDMIMTHVNRLESDVNNGDDQKIKNGNADILQALLKYIRSITSISSLTDEKIKESIEGQMCKIQAKVNQKHNIGSIIWYIIGGLFVSLVVRYQVNNIPLDTL